MFRKAFDFSNWTRVPTADDCVTLRNLGYTTAIVGASFNPGLARQQIAVLVTFGFRIEVYAWLRHPIRDALLQNAIDACTGFPVERMWLDVEDAEDAMGRSPDELAQDVRLGVSYLRTRLTIEVGIYTGSWFWDDYMETTDTFGCRLWLANYVTTPNVAFIHAHLPGGWTPETLVIWQWNNHLAGTDFNADDNLILVEVSDMSPEETAAAIKAYVDPKVGALFGNALNNGADIVRHGAQISALASAFAAHVQEGGGTLDPAFAARLTTLEAEHAALVKRVLDAAAALAQPPA